MKPLVYLLQPLPAHVGVDLRRRDVRMPQHDLNRSKVRPPLEQVRRKGMPERVGVDLPLQAGHLRIFLDQFP